MQIQTVFRAGNSDVVAIPKDLVKKTGLKKGSKVFVEIGFDQKTLTISKASVKRQTSSVTPEFLRIVEGVNKRYGPALAKLAKL